jgi:sugar lactone lactonase YvrE
VCGSLREWTTTIVRVRTARAATEKRLVFPESPRWRDGRLVFSDIYAGAVRELREDGTMSTICEVPALPSGLGWDTRGRMIISSMLDRRVLRLGPEGLSEVADLSALVSTPKNDMLVDRWGRAYISNVGFDFDSEPVRPVGMLLVTEHGEVSMQGGELRMPNGAVLADEGRTLIVAETFGARLTAFDVAELGTLSGQRTWASVGPRCFDDVAEGEASGDCLPDGLALDAAGAVWVADAGGGVVQRIAEGGDVLDAVDVGGLTAYGVALGGKDGRTLYICASPPFAAGPPAEVRGGSILACHVDVPGV